MAKQPLKKGSPSDDDRLTMIASTHSLAKNMVEDLVDMRENISKTPPSPGYLRRASNLLRRLLIDKNGDLRKIAPPRLKRRPMIVVPDSKPFVEEINSKPHYLGSLCATGIAGFGPASIYMVSKAGAPGDSPRVNLYGRKANPENTREVPVNVDGFLNQRVFYFSGQWITRAQVIKYVANVAGGVHSGAHKEPTDDLLHHIRQIMKLSMTNGEPALSLNPRALSHGAVPILEDRDGLDFLLLQMMAAVRCLLVSPDMIELETIINNERIRYVEKPPST